MSIVVDICAALQKQKACICLLFYLGVFPVINMVKGLIVSSGACNLGVPGSDPGGCALTVLRTVQRPRVYSAAYGAEHSKEPLKSFEIRVGHRPGFGLPSVAILP